MNETRYSTAIGGLEVHPRVGEAWRTWDNESELPPGTLRPLIEDMTISRETLRLPTSAYTGRTPKGRARRS